jgi:hypothetical protein
MFEHLESIRSDLKPMFGRLRKLTADEIEPMRKLYPQCPAAYWAFLMERGAGALEQDGEPFFFEDHLVSAETELYRDRLIYDNGAKGDVMFFGSESMGTAYGFDSGDNWRLVEVDEFRIVTPLSLTFEQFIDGLILCYPQIAISVEGKEWIDGVGTRYQLPAPTPDSERSTPRG